MNRLFPWFILRALSRDRLRSAVTVAGVAAGIAVVLAIRLANASAVGGFEAALDAVAGRTSLEVVAPGGRVADARLARLGWLREFGPISPVIDGDVVIRGLSGSRDGELVRVLGVDILRDRPFRDYRLGDDAAGRMTTQAFLAMLTDGRSIVLTRAFAERHGLAEGSRVELVTGDRVVPLMVRGLLDAEGPAAIQGGNFGLMDIAAAQLALGRIGSVDRIDVRLDEGVSVETAQAAIAARLPAGLIVQRPERRGAQVEKMLAAFQFNLAALSYVALLVGVFLVYNTVSVSVITRRSEIGMLRTVGVARRTVLGLFLGEAIGLAVAGCMAGVPLGWLLARAAVELTSSTVSTFWVRSAATVPMLTLADIGLALVVALPLAVGAALAPAVEAARLPPVSAVRNERDLAVRAALPRRYLGGATVLFAVGGWCASRPPVDGLPVFGLLAALAVVLGGALLVPVVLHQVQRRRSWLDARLGVEGIVARSYVGASVRRLAVSVAALAVSLAMMVAIAVMIGSFRETVVYWVGQTLQADLFVAAGRGGALGDRGAVSSATEAAIASHPDVLAVDAFRSIDIPYRDSLIIVASGRFRVLLDHGRLLFKAPADGRAAMASAAGRDAAVVSESFSLRYGHDVGDVVVLPTPAGDRPVRVAAVYFDYASDRGQVVLDEPVFDRYYDRRRPSGLTVYLTESASAEIVRDEILGRVDGRPLFVNTNASLRRQVLEVFDSTFAITYALEGIAIVVSIFGVGATLVTLALERRRDTTVLRLLGAERRHLRRMISMEAAVLGTVSLAVGLGVGLLLSLILIFVINVQSFGWTIQFHLPVTFLIQTSILVLGGTTLAGLYPARLARRWTVSDLSGQPL